MSDSTSTTVECLRFSEDFEILVGEKGQGLIGGLWFPRDSKSEENIKRALYPDEIDFKSHMNIGDTIAKLVTAERQEKLHIGASMFEIRPPLLNKNRRGAGFWIRHLIEFLNHGSPWNESWKEDLKNNNSSCKHDVMRALDELLIAVEADGELDKMKKYSFHMLLKHSEYGGDGKTRERFTLFMFQATTNKRGFRFDKLDGGKEKAGMAFSFHTFSIPN